MTAVPSTPTATDKLEEVRKLNIEIAKLTSAKDTVHRAAVEAQNAYQDAKTRADAIEGHLATLEASMAGASREVTEFVARCRNILHTAVLAMEEATQIARDLEARANAIIEQIGKDEKKLADLQASMAREDEIMTRKKSDLDVYHRRIVAAAEKHLPGQKIVI